jgi:hypothetical protein
MNIQLDNITEKMMKKRLRDLNSNSSAVKMTRWLCVCSEENLISYNHRVELVENYTQSHPAIETGGCETSKCEALS